MTTFADYMDGLGAEQFNTAVRRPLIPATTYGAQDRRGPTVRPNYTMGQDVSVTPQAAPTHMGNFNVYGGYRDDAGGFLGYGSNYDDLYAMNPALQLGYQESVANDPARQAQILENRRLEAEYARVEHEQRLQMMADRQSSLPTLANFAPTPQMGGGLLGQQPQQMQQMPQQQMPQQQMQQQPQGINPYALHRGSQGGMGLMGGGLTRGGVAPAGGGQ